MLNFLTRIFGSRNDRVLKSLARDMRAANAFEPALQALGDEQLRAKTDEFRTRLAAGETVDRLLPEAFAVVREAAQGAYPVGSLPSMLTEIESGYLLDGVDESPGSGA